MATELSFDEAMQRLAGSKKHELLDHAFGDAEVSWYDSAIDSDATDNEIAFGYFNGTISEVTVVTTVGVSSGTKFDGDQARQLREQGTPTIDRNDTTGPDRYAEGVCLPALTLEGVHQELTVDDPARALLASAAPSAFAVFLEAFDSIVEQDAGSVVFYQRAPVTVALWKNVAPSHLDVTNSMVRRMVTEGYLVDDPLCNVWEGSPPEGVATSLNDLVGAVWQLHNIDERPTGQLCPSASVGDVCSITIADNNPIFVAFRPTGTEIISPPDPSLCFRARTRDEYVAIEAAIAACPPPQMDWRISE